MQLSQERNRVFIKNSVYNYIAKAFYYIFSFLTVPLALNFLGKEKFGIFQTILTLISWAALANLGLGNGLRNKISEYLGLNRENEIKSLIGTAFSLTAIISSILAISGSLYLWYFFEPNWLFKDLKIDEWEVRLTFVTSFIFFCINLFLNLFSSIAYGIHKSYLASVATTIQYALYCLLLWILILMKLESFLVYVSITYGISLILSQIFPLISFYNNKTIWKPKFDNRKKYYKELLKMSIGFFGLQISTVILFSSDNFIISKLLGANDVAAYSIAAKIYFLIINLFSILLIQVWNSTTDALARKDYDWIRKTLRKLYLFLIPITIGSFIISFFLNQIIKIWTSEVFGLDLFFRLSFAFYVLIHCSNAIIVNILNGLGRLKIQMISYTFAALMNFFLSYIFLMKMELGINGIIYSKIICMIITLGVCFFDYYYFIKEKKQ